MLLESGRASTALVCGYDSIQRVSWAGLSALRVMALPEGDGPPVVRPFDAERTGTVFSEGAACMLLESEERRSRRGIAALAHLLGGAANNNAHHLTHADEEGEGTAAAMRDALADAGLGPDQVDHVNAHGTGTALNDVTEARSLHAVFGDRASAVPVVSNKGGLGHSMGAASLMEAVASVLVLREQRIPPTANLRRIDPDCRLDVVSGEPRDVAVNVVLSNSAGIGGANSAVVLTV
jgi:3-oxoacyl-(acyl-carrier-protein) synthase